MQIQIFSCQISPVLTQPVNPVASTTDSIAKLVFDMCGNCSNCRFETCKSSSKRSLAQVCSCKFCKIFMNPFFTEHLQTTAMEFFCSFYCFLPPGKLTENSFFYFWTCFILGVERDEYHEFK